MAPTPRSDIARLHNIALDGKCNEEALYSVYKIRMFANTATTLNNTFITQTTMFETEITSLTASLKKSSNS